MSGALTEAEEGFRTPPLKPPTRTASQGQFDWGFKLPSLVNEELNAQLRGWTCYYPSPPARRPSDRPRVGLVEF